MRNPVLKSYIPSIYHRRRATAVAESISKYILPTFVVWNIVKKPLWKMYLEACTEEQLRSIYEEFDATPELIEQNVQSLISWLEEQPHLPNITDEKWLRNILLRCKNQMERTKSFLEQYYTYRVKLASIFTHRDPCGDEIQRCMKVVAAIPMPKLTPDGYRVVCYRIFEHQPEDLPSPEVVLRSYQMTADILLKDDCHKGLIVISNSENTSYKFFTMQLSSLRQSLLMATKVNRVRLHRVHILNMTSVLEILLTLTKYLLKKELADRFQMWNKPTTDLCEIVPKECLPKDYGGEERSLEECRDLWGEHLKTFQEWFIAEESIKADLSLKPKTSLFGGMFGSKN